MQITGEMVEAAWEAYDNAPGHFTNSELMRAAITAALAKAWRPIEEAKEDQWVLIIAFAPAAHGLPAIVRPCQWHPDAGFCVDELRTVTHWMPLPEPPATKEGE